jgi:lysophospholipase
MVFPTAMFAAAKPDLESTLARPDLALHLEYYRPGGQPRLALVMVHGFSAHCGLYRHVGAALAAHGIAVTQFDCRGHGRSQGRRGHVDDFGQYLDDLAAVVSWARQQAPALPWALLGHSLGGAIALAYALDQGHNDKPGRLVLLAPWLKLRMRLPAAKRLAAPVAARLVPTLTMPNGLRAEDVSRNPLVLANFDKDPLVHHVASAGWFLTTLRAQAHVRTQAQHLKVPTLMMLAGDDRIVANETNLAFAQAAGDIVVVKTYDGLFHEMFLEPESAIVIQDVRDWLAASRA